MSFPWQARPWRIRPAHLSGLGSIVLLLLAVLGIFWMASHHLKHDTTEPLHMLFPLPESPHTSFHLANSSFRASVHTLLFSRKLLLSLLKLSKPH